MIVSTTMDAAIYSVRMRASCGGQHLSGAERLVSKREVESVVAELSSRALQASGGEAAEICCSIDKVDPASVQYAMLPDLEPFQVESPVAGHALAKTLLERAGVPDRVAVRALSLLANGGGPGGSVMRGAVLMDSRTGKRLEADHARGVRASRMDLTVECRLELERLLAGQGLNHRRVVEALTLSGKVLNTPGLVAELCWSDDPNYTAGYVASPVHGYQRISEMKRTGDPLGGRVFLIDTARTDLADVTAYLEKQPVLLNRTGKILPAVAWEESL